MPLPADCKKKGRCLFNLLHLVIFTFLSQNGLLIACRLVNYHIGSSSHLLIKNVSIPKYRAFGRIGSRTAVNFSFCNCREVEKKHDKENRRYCAGQSIDQGILSKQIPGEVCLIGGCDFMRYIRHSQFTEARYNGKY